MKTVFTTGEAAKICRLSLQVIIRHFDDGKITGFRVPPRNPAKQGGHRRIPRATLEKFMDKYGLPKDLLPAEPATPVPENGSLAAVNGQQ